MESQLIQTIDMFNLIASVFGIVMAVIALVLSLVFFFSAKKTEHETDIVMRELKSSTASLERLSMKLLDRMSKALVAPNPTEERLIDVLKNIATTGNLPTVNETEQEQEGKVTKPQLEQFRIDNLITAAFYAATANITMQKVISDLPVPQRNDPDSTLINGLNASGGDFETLVSWVKSSDDWEHKVEVSPVKQYWRGVESVASDVLTYEKYRSSLIANE